MVVLSWSVVIKHKCRMAATTSFCSRTWSRQHQRFLTSRIALLACRGVLTSQHQPLVNRIGHGFRQEVSSAPSERKTRAGTICTSKCLWGTTRQRLPTVEILTTSTRRPRRPSAPNRITMSQVRIGQAAATRVYGLRARHNQAAFPHVRGAEPARGMDRVRVVSVLVSRVLLFQPAISALPATRGIPIALWTSVLAIPAPTTAHAVAVTAPARRATPALPAINALPATPGTPAVSAHAARGLRLPSTLRLVLQRSPRWHGVAPSGVSPIEMSVLAHPTRYDSPSSTRLEQRSPEPSSSW